MTPNRKHVIETMIGRMMRHGQAGRAACIGCLTTEGKIHPCEAAELLGGRVAETTRTYY